MDSLFRGLNRQLLPNSHIFFLAAVESTVVSILPGAPFFKRELFCGGAREGVDGNKIQMVAVTFRGPIQLFPFPSRAPVNG